MTGQFGTRLVASALAAMLAGMVGTAAAQDSGGGARHFERFTDHELRMCQGASALMQDINEGDVKAHYLENYFAFGEGIAAFEPIEVFTDRVYLMFHQLSREELKGLADACEQALEVDAGGARFTLARPEIIGADAFATFTATRAAEREAAERGRQAYAEEERERERAAVARLSEECGAALERGTDKATRSFRQAQSEIQVWIRAGAFGSAPGEYDIQNGCIAINDTRNALARMECPAEFGNALEGFARQYYIAFNEQSSYSCN
jgi:hypothetical protein